MKIPFPYNLTPNTYFQISDVRFATVFRTAQPLE